MTGRPELLTVSDDDAVAFAGTRVLRYEGLSPGREYDYDGVAFRTLERPGGPLLARIATVNDLHFGETECGRLGGHDVGPVLSAPEGAEPYPSLMGRAAVAEIAVSEPDLVVAKGDVTSAGTAGEYAAFEACFRPPLGDRLVVTRGNHDHPAAGPCFDADAVQVRHLDGVTVVALDTSRAGHAGGDLDPAQLDAVDELAAGADRPVLVMGHHPVPDPEVVALMGGGAGLSEASAESLVALVARRPAVAGYLAGHTHRNRVRRFAASGAAPFAEVASTKDFPGSWAEYRVYEGGLVAVHRRISSSEALAWSEACRAMFLGLYAGYAAGALDDRCYRFGWSRPPAR